MSQGATNRREGFSPYNKIYEFGYMVQVNFPLFGWGSLQCLFFRVSRLRWWWLPCPATSSTWSLRHNTRNGEFWAFSNLQHIFRYSCNPIALFDAPMSKGLGEGNSSALIKKTLQKEVTWHFLLVLRTHLMFGGEGRTTPDNLDRLRQRRGKHWHGSCLCLQVELIDLENIAIDESLYSICREVAPRVRVLRAKFSEITRPSIDRAMATLGQVLLNIQALR